MKKLILLILIIFSMSNLSATDKSVILAGSTGGGIIVRTRTSLPSVVATQSEEYITLKFNRDLSVVTTTIYNELGEVVYENETVTGYGVVEIIDTIDFEEGNYTIVLTNNYGLHLEGNFVL